MRRRSLSHSNKTGQKEGKNDLKQSQVQIDRLENQVQELKKKLDVERSQVGLYTDACIRACYKLYAVTNFIYMHTWRLGLPS